MFSEPHVCLCLFVCLFVCARACECVCACVCMCVLGVACACMRFSAISCVSNDTENSHKGLGVMKTTMIILCQRAQCWCERTLFPETLWRIWSVAISNVKSGIVLLSEFSEVLAILLQEMKKMYPLANWDKHQKWLYKQLTLHQVFWCLVVECMRN